jgi:hypothetical protein
MKATPSSLLLAALLVLPSSLSAQFQFCGTDCVNVCNSESLCNRGCTLSCNTQTTCGGYGVCNPDPDGDSVIWNDNCPSTYNPNQADCDGDGRGTACDTDNGIWSQIGAFSMCLILDNMYGGYVGVQAHYKAEYQDVSACGSPNRWKTASGPVTTCYSASTAWAC